MAAIRKGISLVFFFSCLFLVDSSSCEYDGDICFDYYDESDNNKTCLLLHASMVVSVMYNETINGTPHVQTVWLPVNCSLVHVNQTESFCNVNIKGNKKETLNKTVMVAYWGTENESSLPFKLIIEALDLDSKDNQWNISNITVEFNVQNLPGYNHTTATDNIDGIVSGYYTGDSKNHELFGTVDRKKYYHCDKNQTFKLTMNNAVNSRASYLSVSLSIADVRVQAYAPDDDTFSSKCSNCYQDLHDDKAFIPIVVGSVIGGLVLVVLVSYIVGRFRNYKKKSNSGYEKL